MMTTFSRFTFRTAGGRRVTVTGCDVNHARTKAREELQGRYAREGLEFPTSWCLTLVEHVKGKRRKRPNWTKFREAQGRFANRSS